MPQVANAQIESIVDPIVHEMLTSTGTPGAIVGLWLPDHEPFTQTYGIGDRETGAPPLLDDHFRIASITKTFVATVLLQLVDEGLVALDTTIGEFDLDFPQSKTATLANLLGMTAGIYDYTHDDAFVARYEADPLMPFTPSDALAIARRHDPLFAPGKGISYCDTNTVVAGKIAERVSGRSIEQLVTDRIIVPYGLAATSFPTVPELPSPALRGYVRPGESTQLQDATLSNPNVAWAAGAMVSTLHDLHTWAQLLAAGDLLSAKTQRARLHMRKLHRGQPVRYGLGIAEIYGFLGHNGGIAGYSIMMLHDPKIGATVVTATNLSGLQSGGADTIALKLIQHFFPDRFAS